MLSTGTWVLLSTTAGLGAAYLVNSLLGSVIFRKRRKGEPPIVKGHFLWGSGEEFSHHAVDFLHKTEKEYGDVFTIRLVNKYLTVIMDPHSIEEVSKERNFDFDPIQKQVNKNVFDFVLKEPRKMVKDTARTVRGPYLERAMTSFTSNLTDSFHQVASKNSHNPHEWHQGGLRVFASETMFHSIFNTVFGTDHHATFNPSIVYENFEKFHHYFNLLWLGFPGFLFPDALKCVMALQQQPNSHELINRPDSSDYIKTSIAYMKSQGQSETDIQGHNLVYLHVNYNTFRLSFWVLVNLLENPEARKALMEELDEAVDERLDDKTNTAVFTTPDVEKLPVLDSICNESLRLCSGVFMVRYITKDTTFKTVNKGEEFLMREGDRIAIYPPATHKDPEIYENPLEFKYDRFINATFYKNGKELKHPLNAFGTICTGKRYAMLQLKWYIINVMTTFDMENRSDFKAEIATEYHGHEILPPRKDIDFAFKQRENAVTLEWCRD